MEDHLKSLVEQRPEPERVAIYLVVQMIAQYGGKDGTGLFTGVARYQVLQARLEQAAVSARDLVDFWSRACKLMLWPVGSRSGDGPVLHLLATANSPAVLAVLRRGLAAVVMIARSIAAEDRSARQTLARSIAEELAAIDAADTAQPLCDPEPTSQEQAR